MQRSLIASLALGLLLAPATALAHPAVDAARTAYGDAEFDRALSLVEVALERTDLARADLVDAFEIRSLVLYAMGEELEMHRALVALTELAPGFEVPATHPPAWRAAFERAREEAEERPLAIAIDGDDDGETLVLEIETRGDPARLARGHELTYRRGDETPETVSSETVRIPWADASTLIATAALIGPGGVRIAEAGETRFERDEGSALASPWLWIGLGVVAAAAVAVIVAVATRPEANTVIGGAMVVPPE